MERKRTVPNFTNISSSIASNFLNNAQKTETSLKGENSHHINLTSKVKKGIFDSRNKKEKPLKGK